MIRKKLSDSVGFCGIETDRFKSNYLSISFLLPFDKKTSAMNDLILSVLERGTKSYPDMLSISKKLDELYGADISTKSIILGDVQVLTFSMNVLNNAYVLEDTDVQREALALLLETVYAPVTENGVFSDAYFESEKQNLADEIEAKINNKAKYAFEHFSDVMFAGENCRKYSDCDLETVRGLTNAEVYAQYQIVLHRARMEIVFVGNTDTDALLCELTQGLDGRMPTDLLPVTTDVKRTAGEVKTVTESCIGKQGNLVMGFRTGKVLADGDYPTMALLCELYGGGASSMLFMNVREKMSLCYFCVSTTEALKGAMFVRAGIENDNLEKAKGEVLRQLSLLQAGEFTEEEFSTAKLSLINSYRELADNPQGLQNWYLGRLLSGIEQDPEEAIQAVESVTKAQILEAAANIRLDTVYFLEGKQEVENA